MKYLTSLIQGLTCLTLHVGLGDVRKYIIPISMMVAVESIKKMQKTAIATAVTIANGHGISVPISLSNGKKTSSNMLPLPLFPAAIAPRPHCSSPRTASSPFRAMPAFTFEAEHCVSTAKFNRVSHRSLAVGVYEQWFYISLETLQTSTEERGMSGNVSKQRFRR